MMSTDHYATYRHLDGRLRAEIEACTHEPKRMGFSFMGRTAECCMDCARAARVLAGIVRDAWKSARKRELADMPRCEYCNRRGKWLTGAGPNRPLLCGAHLKLAQRYATGGLFHTFTGPDVRAILDGAIELERAER